MELNLSSLLSCKKLSLFPRAHKTAEIQFHIYKSLDKSNLNISKKKIKICIIPDIFEFGVTELFGKQKSQLLKPKIVHHLEGYLH